MKKNNIAFNFLKNLELVQLELFISILNDNNIIIDSENEFGYIPRFLFEDWNDDCTNFIIRNGYENEFACFHPIAEKVEKLGFVYCLFDINQIDVNYAQKYILKYKFQDI